MNVRREAQSTGGRQRFLPDGKNKTAAIAAEQEEP